MITITAILIAFILVLVGITLITTCWWIILPIILDAIFLGLIFHRKKK